LIKGLSRIYNELWEKALQIRMRNKTEFNKYVNQQFNDDVIKQFAKEYNLKYVNAKK
jgi:hypothetical protein